MMKSPPRIYYGNALVKDITNDVVFGPQVRRIAEYYERVKATPALQVSNPDLGGEVTSVSYLRPTGRSDLARIREGWEVIYASYHGYVGRSPDYIDNWTMVYGAHSRLLSDLYGPRIGENSRRLYEESASQGRFFTHAIVHPQYDRSQPPAKWDDPFRAIGVVEKTSEGLRVKGAAQVCTAPNAEVVIYTPEIKSDTDLRHALAFAIPTSTEGVNFFPRRSFYPRGESPKRDYPISAAFEESDALLYLDNVLIPWDNVLAYAGASSTTPPVDYRSMIGLDVWFNYHFAIQNAARLKFLQGLAMVAAEAIGVNTKINIEQGIGTIIRDGRIVEGGILGAEDEGVNTGYLFMPDPGLTRAVSYYCTEALPRAYQTIRQICGGLLLPIPADPSALANPEIGYKLTHSLETKILGASDRVRLSYLLWDVLDSETAMRYQHYDMFARGDLFQTTASLYRNLDPKTKDALLFPIREVLEGMKE